MRRSLFVSFFACVVAAFAPVAWSQALPPFEVKSVSWYQSAPVLKLRLGGGGGNALAGFLEQVATAAGDVVGKLPRGKPFSGALVVAVKPGAQARYWVVQGEPVLTPKQVESITLAMSKAKPVDVTGGPVAVAVLFDAWGGGVPVATPTMPVVVPEEWLAVLNDPRAKGPLPDGPLAVLWPDPVAAGAKNP